MREENYRDQKSINVPLDELFEKVASDYDLGEVSDFSKVEIGYEDNNYILATEKGQFFVKIFGNYRDLEECKRYISIIEKAQAAGVSTPKLFSLNGKALYQYEDANLAVFEYIEGKTYYELNRLPSEEEARAILAEAAKINEINFELSFVYDEWAIINILDQYPKVEPYLSDSEKEKLAPLVERFKEINLDDMPHCLVHGDIIVTNAMIDEGGKIYIIDFACANNIPRIAELAVLGCNLLANFEPDFLLKEYQKHIEMSEKEIELFPLFLDLAHAMHIIGAVRERDIYGNGSDENDYWLNQGKKGLGIG